MVDALVGERLLQVLRVIDRRGDDLARVCHRAEKLDALRRNRLRVARQLVDLRPQLIEMRDQRVVPWKGMAHARQLGKNGADIADAVLGNEAEAVVVVAADFYRSGFYWH